VDLDRVEVGGGGSGGGGVSGGGSRWEVDGWRYCGGGITGSFGE
jgi:hypothetical protein